MRTHTLILYAIVLSLTAALIILAGCESSAPAAQASENSAESGGDAGCAQVTECCEEMGDQYGGGALETCEATAKAGVPAACNAYLGTNKQVHETEGHPLKGKMIESCMP